MLEETQDRISSIGISPPLIGGDQRHEESAEYPVMDYDVLSDGEDEVKPMHECSSCMWHDVVIQILCRLWIYRRDRCYRVDRSLA